MTDTNIKPNNVTTNEPEDDGSKSEKKKSTKAKYILYIAFVLFSTGLALFFSLYQDFFGVMEVLLDTNLWGLLLIIFVVGLSYLIDGLIIMVFMKLYTRKYHFHQGLAVSMVGAFYSGITPGASGGQVMQVYTLKKQGAEVSNAASIMVMYFILYQIALISFGVFAILFKWNLLSEIGSFAIKFDENFTLELSLIPLTIIGFVINLSVILMLFLMSYSHKFHNFCMRYGIGFLAKLHIIKNPDKTRENLRIQVENFKIELRRLQSNIPTTILILILCTLMLICRFSIPWLSGIALDAYGYVIGVDGQIVHTVGDISIRSMFDACFLSSYHQMITGLIPLPGSAGVSELFFAKLFSNFYSTPAKMTGAQIIWRTATFSFVLLVAGLVSAFYKASPKEHALQASRETYLTIQLETYEERKKTSDTLFETTQLNRKLLQDKIKSSFLPNASKGIPDEPLFDNENKVSPKKDTTTNINIKPEDNTKPNNEVKKPLIRTKKKKPSNNNSGGWRDININSDDD